MFVLLDIIGFYDGRGVNFGDFNVEDSIDIFFWVGELVGGIYLGIVI